MNTGALAAALMVVAFLYASVGHGGASGYLAVLALAGIDPAAMKPTALVLNLVVAGIGSFQFARAGLFRWRKFWPFAVSSIPFAIIGGALKIPAGPYRALLGVILLLSAARLFATARMGDRPERDPSPIVAVPLGALIGFLSGVTGVGGGIFLSPVLLLFGWANARTTAAVSAFFIVANSLAGLAGHVSSLGSIPPAVVLWAPLTAVGGLAGSTLGSRKLPEAWIRRLLAVVLVLAGAKLLLARS
jgi:uncharacterized membrane protein YfcA